MGLYWPQTAVFLQTLRQPRRRTGDEEVIDQDGDVTYGNLTTGRVRTTRLVNICFVNALNPSETDATDESGIDNYTDITDGGFIAAQTIGIANAIQATVVTRVTLSVAISIGLVAAGELRAVVADISKTVAVRICLVDVGMSRAIVTSIATAVTVSVDLVSVWFTQAVVTSVLHSIAVVIRIARTGIAGCC
jgi:hypothetical protein